MNLHNTSSMLSLLHCVNCVMGVGITATGVNRTWGERVQRGMYVMCTWIERVQIETCVHGYVYMG